MAYIAARPVHFDREYKIGEIIPPEAIDPAMSRKLIEMGKIIEISLPEPKKPEPEPTGEGSPEAMPNAAETAGDTNIPAEGEPQEAGQDSTPEADKPQAKGQDRTLGTAPKPTPSRKAKKSA